MAQRLTAGLKGIVSNSSNLFESLNLRYFGPIDGHNITKLVDTLKRPQRYSRTQAAAY